MKKGMQKEYLQSFKACKDIIFKNITETTFSSPKILKKILEINEWLFSISGVRCYKTNEQPKPAITFRFCDPINGANEDPFLRINYRPQSGSVIFFADEKTKVKAPEYMEKTKKNRPWLEVKAQDIDRLSIEKFKKHIIDAYKDKYKKSPKIQSLSIASNTPHLLINKDTLLDDIKDIILNKSLNETEKETKVLCRIGQGIFRENLIKYWKCCSVTGFKIRAMLKASHIKPWAKCNNEERLDIFNGLLLIPNLDYAFDKGFITFSYQGDIIISDEIISVAGQLGIKNDLKIKLEDNHQKYLTYHRENIFRKSL